MRFADLPIHRDTKRAFSEVLRYEFATKVQSESLPPCLAGSDVLAKAKTGTGKTIAFLVPVIEIIMSVPSDEKYGFISALIISPTRELAQQIEEEAKHLCSFHIRSGAIRGTLSVVGGQKIGRDLSALKSHRQPDILVATPGRLIDHLENHGLQKMASRLRVLVFDEADQLFEMGFMPEIKRILGQLPKPSTRQTLLFSATMPTDVEQLAHKAMRPDNFVFVDTVGKEENTHKHVPQQFTICPFGAEASQLLKHLLEETKTPNFKAIVFFVTARMTQYYSELFKAAGLDVLEIHSRKSQSQREKVAAEFRRRDCCFLFTSDVSARGMDYPDVTGVFQMGAPSDAAQYVHRLGRTARAGLGGHGVLILGDHEEYFLREIKDLPLTKLCYEEDDTCATAIQNALAQVDRVKVLPAAYQAWLGYYNGNLKKLRWSKNELVLNANRWAELQGCREPPSLLAKTVGKMGLKGIPGLNIERGGGGGRGRGGGQGHGRSGGSGRGGGGGGVVGGNFRNGANQNMSGHYREDYESQDSTGRGRVGRGRGRGRDRSGRGDSMNRDGFYQNGGNQQRNDRFSGRHNEVRGDSWNGSGYTGW